MYSLAKFDTKQPNHISWVDGQNLSGWLIYDNVSNYDILLPNDALHVRLADAQAAVCESAVFADRLLGPDARLEGLLNAAQVCFR